MERFLLSVFFYKSSFLKRLGMYLKRIVVFDTTSLNCEVISMVVGVFYLYGNTLRFPGAAGEPPRANALRGLAEAFPPPGVSVYFLRRSEERRVGKECRSGGGAVPVRYQDNRIVGRVVTV